MAEMKKHIERLSQELRRGTLTLAVLSQLSEPQYGYSLVTILNEKEITVEPGTLYPLLRRLEKQGLLDSKWDTNESRPRKYYLLSDMGKKVFEELIVEWDSMVTSLNRILFMEGDKVNGTD